MTKKGMQILLRNSQAGPGRNVKQEQEDISRNHVPSPLADLCTGTLDSKRDKISLLLSGCHIAVTTSFHPAEGISCYVCPHHDGTHICDPLELWGNRTQCPEGVTTCYKSWSGKLSKIKSQKSNPVNGSPDNGSILLLVQI